MIVVAEEYSLNNSRKNELESLIKQKISVDDEDLPLWQEAKDGNFKAFQELMNRFQNRVYGLAFRILNNPQDAEDIVQQTFLTLVEQIDRYRGESKVKTWILGIATNHALKLLRKRKGQYYTSFNDRNLDSINHEPLPHPEYIAVWRDNPENLATQKELKILLSESLNRLEEAYRTVFILRDIEGLSTEETANILDISLSNVKIRLLRARLQLREDLTKKLGIEATRLISTHSEHPISK